MTVQFFHYFGQLFNPSFEQPIVIMTFSEPFSYLATDHRRTKRQASEEKCVGPLKADLWKGARRREGWVGLGPRMDTNEFSNGRGLGIGREKNGTGLLGGVGLGVLSVVLLDRALGGDFRGGSEWR